MVNLDKKCIEGMECLPEISELTDAKQTLCPVTWALDVIKKARSQACGKSVMCRDGLWQLEHIIEDATTGAGQSEDLELINDVLESMKMLGCELVQKVVICVSTSISMYSEEWESHIKRKRCKALVCKAYYTVHINPEKCQGAGACITVCPNGAITGKEGYISVVDSEKCTRCGACYSICKSDAIVRAGAVKPKTSSEPVLVGSFEESVGRRRRRRG